MIISTSDASVNPTGDASRITITAFDTAGLDFIEFAGGSGTTCEWTRSLDELIYELERFELGGDSIAVQVFHTPVEG